VNGGPFSNYTSSNQIEWTAVAGPDNDVHVEVRNVGSPNPFDGFANYTAYNVWSPANVTGLQPDVDPGVAGNPVNWTATVDLLTGSGSYEYAYLVDDAVLQNYTTSNNWTWTPADPDDVGTHKVSVYVRNVGSPNDPDSLFDVNGYEVIPSIKITSFTNNTSTPILAGDVIDWQATADSGAGGAEFQFLLDTTPMQGYTSLSAWTWDTAGAEGVHEVAVRAQTAGSTSGYYDEASSGPFTVYSSVSVTLRPGLPEPLDKDTFVTWYADATGGTGEYQYQFELNGPSTSGWEVVQPFSPDSNWGWTTSGVDVGLNSVRVTVRNLGRSDDNAMDTYADYQVTLPVVLDPLVSSLAKGTSGQPVTFTATAHDGTGNYEFEFQHKVVGGNYSTVQNWSPTPTYDWTPLPSDEGGHYIRVAVRKAESPTGDTEASTYMYFRVLSPVHINSLTPDPLGPIGATNPVVLTPSTSGGLNDYEYQFQLNGPGTGYTWSVLQDYTSTTSWTWNTTDADIGTNSIRVRARNAGLNEPFYDELDYPNYEVVVNYVSAYLNSFTSDVQSPQNINTPITFTADAGGGSGTILYRYMRKGPDTGGVPQVFQDWTSVTPTWSWTPNDTQIGWNYVKVQVKDLNKPDDIFDDEIMIPYQVVNPIYVESLNPGVPSPRTYPDPVTFTAVARGGTPGVGYQYRFERSGPDNGYTYAMVQDWSTNKSWYWVPPDVAAAGTGNNYIRVKVRAADVPLSETTFDDVLPITYRILAPAVIDSLTSEYANPGSVGRTDRWVTSAHGATGQFYYRYKRKGPDTSGAYVVERPWDLSPIWDWTPTDTQKGGNYVRVEIKKSIDPLDDTYDAGTWVYYRIVDPVTISEFTCSEVSPGPVDTQVTWTAKGTGGDAGKYQYQFSRKVVGGTYETVQDWSAVNTYSWTPTVTDLGAYYVRVRIRKDTETLDQQEDAKWLYYRVTNPIVITDFYPSVASPTYWGQDVIWTCIAGGGDGSYMYKFLRKGPDTSGDYVEVQGWSTSNTWTWPTDGFSEGGNYIKVCVKKATEPGDVIDAKEWLYFRTFAP